MLQLAMQQGNDSAVQQHAGWITANAAGSPYELPALVQLAQRAAKNDAPAEEGYNVYRRLVEVFGTDVETLKTQKNARIASFNLAKYAAAAGKFDEAADAIERVLQTDPKNKRYLKLAAESSFQAGQHDRAVQHYRTLVRGLPANTDEWYEAKYYQIAALMRSEPAKGKQVLKQFQLMHRDLGAPWEAKFQQLRAEE
jgi:tetratricopeptide (TPR) repeat protein